MTEVNQNAAGFTDKPVEAQEGLLFDSIWDSIKGWDLERSTGDGYAGATGDDVRTIIAAIEPVFGKMTASEAIYGFCAWLTTRDKKTVMSASDDSGAICDLVKMFCEENKLPDPRPAWTTNLVHPSGECSGASL